MGAVMIISISFYISMCPRIFTSNQKLKMMTEDLMVNILGFGGIILGFIGLAFWITYENTDRKNKAHYKRAIACWVIGGVGFLSMLGVAGITFEDILDSSSSSPCNCEEELYIWATGGNTFNTTLKVDCLEKYNGPDYMHVYHKMDGVTNNITFMKAWDKAKKECESN